MASSTSGTPAQTEEAAVYHLDGDLANVVRLIGVVMVVFGVVLTAAFLWILSAPGPGAPDPLPLDGLDIVVGVLPAIVFFPLALAVFATVRSVRLSVAPDGVVFQALRYRARAGWHEVEGWSLVAMGPFSGRGLAVDGATSAVVPWWALVSGRLPLVGRAIPVSPFAVPLEGSQLEAHLRRFRPGLFVGEA
jgi:hypothetical protein